jgi:hypothetical protein
MNKENEHSNMALPMDDGVEQTIAMSLGDQHPMSFIPL